MSVAMATTGMTQITGETLPSSSSSSPSSSSGAELYFHCAVVVIGVVGTVTNGLILYAVVASNQHKKHVLIFNQNALDLFSSLTMAATYSLKLCNIYLTGSAGHWLCTLLLSEFLIWCGMLGSVINLISITVERYLKVVHSSWSKKKLRNWMAYFAVAFSWIASFIYNASLTFSASSVIDGVCFWSESWQEIIMINVVLNFVVFYAIVLFIFIFCYGRILIVIRHQTKVMSGHAAADPSSAAGQAQYNKMQSNVIKTMILVSALYALSFLPSYVYVMIPNHSTLDAGYYAVAGLSYLYTCTNPFVYAIKFEPVKKVILRMIRCKTAPE